MARVRLIFLSLLLASAGSIVPLCAQGARESGPTEYRAGQPPARLSSWALRESEPDPGAFATADIAEGFSPYDGKYISRDPALKTHMYTFRTDILLDEASRTRPIGLFMGPGDYPRDVYLNGVLLFRSGDHGDRYNATVYYSSRVLLPPQLLRYGAEPNKIAVEAFPAYETSPLGDLSVGDWYDITRMVFLRDLFNLHFVRAAMVAAFVIAVFFLFLFFSSPGRDRTYLWFGLVCASFALGYTNMSFYNDAANDVLLDKLSRIGLPLTTLFLAYFAIRFTGLGEGRRWLKPLLALPVLAGMIATSVQPDKQGVATVFSSVTTNFVLTPGLLYILALLVVGLVRRPQAPRAVVLAGFLAAIAASVHDILYLSRHVAPFAYLVAYGYLAMLVAIFFVLALDQSKVARELALKTRNLDEQGRSREEMLRDLTRLSEGLVSASSTLEGRLSDAIAEVTRYGEDSRAVSEAFKRQVGQFESEIEGITARVAASSGKVPEALRAQAAAVEVVNGSLGIMNERIEESLGSAAQSSRLAAELAGEAAESARVLDLSRKAMTLVAEQGGKLEGVLASIEDVAERTHVLSINAAIESARLGNDGKGFGVVAQEIRKLSDQSRASLKNSFDRIREMTEATGRGSELSVQASASLERILEKARDSAGKTEGIERLITAQRSQGEEIAGSAEELMRQAGTLEALSIEEGRLADQRKVQFLAMRESLGSLFSLLKEQDGRKRGLDGALAAMDAALADTRGHVALLEASVEKAR
jgi:methyl-accepting chemotaxis protein